MEPKSTLEVLRQMLAEMYGVPVLFIASDDTIASLTARYRPEATGIKGLTFIDDIAADSLDAIEFAMALEEAAMLAVPEKEWETISHPENTVEQIAEMLDRYRLFPE
jgi:acyl carrier protein